MISLVLLALVVGVVVWLVVRSRGGAPAPDRGIHTLRRVLQYTFLLVALFTAAVGLARLLVAALPAGRIAGGRATDIALGLSLTVVAVPVWVLLWRSVSRALTATPDERASAGWALYLAGAATVALIGALSQLIEVSRWLLGLTSYEADPVAFAVVWILVWAGHAWLLHHPQYTPTGTPAPLATLAGSTVGLVTVAVGATGVVAAGLRELYRLAAGPVLLDVPLALTLGVSLVVTVLGALTWWWHWERNARRAERGVLWHTYVFLIGVLGGLTTAVVAGAVGLHALVQWWIGVPATTDAAVHFDGLPWAVTAATVGLVIWQYHRSVFEALPSDQRPEPERVYGYLVSAVGLIASAAGATVTIMATIQAWVPDVMASSDPRGRNTLALALTLLVVGLPVWASFWFRLQARTAREGRAERRSISRRSYLILTLGVASLTAAIGLSITLFAVLRELFEGNLTATILTDVRAAIGLVVVAGAIAIYHAAIYRHERTIGIDEVQPHPRDVLLLSPDGRALVSAIAAATGAHVRGLHRLDVEPHTVDVAQITEAILASPHDRVVVTIEEDDSVRVIPYNDR